MSTLTQGFAGIGEAEDRNPELPAGKYVVSPVALSHFDGEFGLCMFFDVRVDKVLEGEVSPGGTYVVKARISGTSKTKTMSNLRDFRGIMKLALAHNEGFQAWLKAGCPSDEGKPQETIWDQIVTQCEDNPEGMLVGSSCLVEVKDHIRQGDKGPKTIRYARWLGSYTL